MAGRSGGIKSKSIFLCLIIVNILIINLSVTGNTLLLSNVNNLQQDESDFYLIGRSINFYIQRDLSPLAVYPYENVTVFYVVYNGLSQNIYNFTIKDTLPENITLVSGNLTASWNIIRKNTRIIVLNYTVYATYYGHYYPNTTYSLTFENGTKVENAILSKDKTVPITVRPKLTDDRRLLISPVVEDLLVISICLGIILWILSERKRKVSESVKK